MRSEPSPPSHFLKVPSLNTAVRAKFPTCQVSCVVWPFPEETAKETTPPKPDLVEQWVYRFHLQAHGWLKVNCVSKKPTPALGEFTRAVSLGLPINLQAAPLRVLSLPQMIYCFFFNSGKRLWKSCILLNLLSLVTVTSSWVLKASLLPTSWENVSIQRT